MREAGLAREGRWSSRRRVKDFRCSRVDPINGRQLHAQADGTALVCQIPAVTDCWKPHATSHHAPIAAAPSAYIERTPTDGSATRNGAT
jgi:hypothetical protein